MRGLKLKRKVPQRIVIISRGNGGVLGVLPSNARERAIAEEIARKNGVSQPPYSDPQAAKRQTLAANTDESANEPGKKRKRTPQRDSWTAIRKSLRTWEHPRLLGLVQDLFATVPEARAAIVGRLNIDEPVSARAGTIAKLLKEVRKAVRPPGGAWGGEPEMGKARKTCDRYYCGSADANGAFAAYFEMIEAGMELSFEFGWDDSGFYDSIARAANVAIKLLPEVGDAELLAAARARIDAMRANTNFPGWGMDEVLDELGNETARRIAECTPASPSSSVRG